MRMRQNSILLLLANLAAVAFVLFGFGVALSQADGIVHIALVGGCIMLFVCTIVLIVLAAIEAVSANKTALT